MRITVRREKSERGLAAVTQGPHGFDVRIKGERVGCVQWARVYGKPCGVGYWYWYAGSDRYGVPRKNTCNEPSATPAIARDACLAYVREHAKESA